MANRLEASAWLQEIYNDVPNCVPEEHRTMAALLIAVQYLAGKQAELDQHFQNMERVKMHCYGIAEKKSSGEFDDGQAFLANKLLKKLKGEGC